MFHQLRSRLLIAGGVSCALLALLLAFFLHNTGRDKDMSRISELLFDELSVQVTAVINDALGTLTAFQNATFGPCNVGSVEAMRRLIYTNIYVKDLAITDNNGHVICSASGFEQIVRMRADSVTLPDSGFTIQPVQVEAAQFEGLMISRGLEPDRRLSALVLSNALLSARGQRVILEDGFALLSLVDGTDVGRYPATRLSAPNTKGSVNFEIIEKDLPQLPLKLKLYVAHSTLDKLMDSGSVVPLILGAVVLGALAFITFLYVSTHRDTQLSELEHALENREFIAYYQPIVNMRTGEFVGCEALIRWRKPNGTIVPPGDFIQQAERSGLAIPMTVALMNQIRDDLEGFYATQPSLKVGINLFSDHFNRRQTAQEVDDVFGPSGINLNQLTFEVTERLPLTSLNNARRVIQDLQQLGCSIALDDVGTGHNGLQYLLELGVDTIKIDKLFVDGLAQSGFSETIIEALVKLAKDMKMGVVAEGVESSEQMTKLKELGIDLAQGYLFSKPLPCEEYLQVLNRAVSKPPHIDKSWGQAAVTSDHIQLISLNERI